MASAHTTPSAATAALSAHGQPRVGPVRHKGAPSLLVSSSTGIAWQPIAGTAWSGWSRDGPAAEHMPYAEIVGARYLPNRGCDCSVPLMLPRRYWFAVHGIQRGRWNHSMWRLRTVHMACSDADDAKAWVRHINQAVSSQPHRPRRLLVFVNPFGGARKAAHVWHTVAAPVLQLARVQCEVVETVAGGHAHSVIAALTPQQLRRLSGIVAVGGDGLFQELVAGLMALRGLGGEAAQAAAALRLGHVPAGSTDAVAYTLNGTRDALTAALHIALGDATALDVGRIDSNDGEHRHFVCMASYGFLGDVMTTSERLRWLGPPRYDIAGVLKYLQLRRYEATIWYLPASEAAAQLPSSCSPEHVAPHHAPGCYEACSVCTAAAAAASTAAVGAGPRAARAAAGAAAATAAVAAASSAATSECESDGLCSSGPPGGDWVCRRGRFVSIMCVVTSCRSDRSQLGVAPGAHLADGRLTLVLVSQCSRAQYLHFLLLLGQRGVSPGMLPFVEVVHATAVQVEPGTAGHHSCWNVDGELVPDGRVRAHVEHAAVRVFARGVEQPPHLRRLEPHATA